MICLSKPKGLFQIRLHEAYKITIYILKIILTPLGSIQREKVSPTSPGNSFLIISMTRKEVVQSTNNRWSIALQN